MSGQLDLATKADMSGGSTWPLELVHLDGTTTPLEPIHLDDSTWPPEVIRPNGLTGHWKRYNWMAQLGYEIQYI